MCLESNKVNCGVNDGGNSWCRKCFHSHLFLYNQLIYWFEANLQVETGGWMSGGGARGRRWLNADRQNSKSQQLYDRIMIGTGSNIHTE